MLIRFNITNFLSFDKETEFNMLAAKLLRSHKDHVYKVQEEINVLKASAIYGANGAGKSNMIKALHSFQEIVENGCVSEVVSENKYRLKEENSQLPVQFEIEFSVSKKIYTYGISFDNNIILEEWLYQTGSTKPKLIFERKHSLDKKHPLIRLDNRFIQTEKAKMLISLMEENLLRQNELFISKNENLKISEITDVVQWIKDNLIIIFPNSKSEGFISNFNSVADFKDFSNELLGSFDVGIHSLSLKNWDLDEFLAKLSVKENMIKELKKKIDEGKSAEIVLGTISFGAFKDNNKYVAKTITTNHFANNSSTIFDIRDESDGTQRLTDFIPMVYSLLHFEKTFVIDELDRSLHPSIVHKLIHKIMENSATKGQLIFTTHEASLLNCNIFRTDEIWFAEKDKETQSTQLYTLNEFKPRADLDIEKGYLNGRFGAIPFLSKLEDLNWQE